MLRILWKLIHVVQRRKKGTPKRALDAQKGLIVK